MGGRVRGRRKGEGRGGGATMDIKRKGVVSSIKIVEKIVEKSIIRALLC